MNSLICATFGSIMMNVLYVIIAIVVLLTMVLIHELGHYIVGRILGFKITEFSIGFGKALWQRKNKRGELISFRIFPLGGFCAFLGETDDENEQEKTEDKKDEKNEESKALQTSSSKKHCIYCNSIINIEEDRCHVCGGMQEQIFEKQLEQSSQSQNKTSVKQPQYNKRGRLIYDESEGRFNDMRPWKRILVYGAGVTFNFISAFIFSIIFLAVGAYDGYKVSPSENYVVPYYSIEQNVQIGTLQKDTLVYAINGEEINYAQQKVFDSLVGSEDTEIILTIEIDGQKQDVLIKKATYSVKQDDGTFKDEVIFGITYSTVNISYGFGDIMRDFIPFTFHLAFMVLQAFWWIISGQIALNQLGGPISTISQMTVVASYGLANFMYLLPLLAVNLAIFNFLPIPGLDGAHTVFTTIEWIRGKPIKRSIENSIHMWGILLLFAFVIIIDVVHLITA